MWSAIVKISQACLFQAPMPLKQRFTHHSDRHYHFYHFSPRLPLQNVTVCDYLRRVANRQNRGKIVANHFSEKGL
jgi:hypothetical protein